MLNTCNVTTQWRATGAYLSTLASKSSLIEETRLLLAAYKRLGSLAAASQDLINGGLPQRTRASRQAVLKVLQVRFMRWCPPAWVIDELAAFALDTRTDAFQMALLLHIARQDVLLYNFIQHVIAPRWYSGDTRVSPADMQGFLDGVLEEHPEVHKWSFSTREKVSQNALTVLRDCQLLKGAVKKRIVLPVVPIKAAYHLIRLLEAEGIDSTKIPLHPDWNILLWDKARVQQALDSYMSQEK